MTQKNQAEKCCLMSIAQKKENKQALRVFLSYAAIDREYILKLRNLLSGHLNLRIFTTEMLSAGEDWLSRLKDEISKCDVFVVLLSSEIPVYLKGIQPFEIKHLEKHPEAINQILEHYEEVVTSRNQA